ncbi:MAG: Fic family protein [Motiliproteus sp.]
MLRESDRTRTGHPGFLWERSDWPSLTWVEERLSEPLMRASHAHERLCKGLDGIDAEARNEVHLQTLTQDLVKSTEIRETAYDPEKVRSSVARRLGMEIGGLVPSDRNEDAVVDMMLDATDNYAQPLTVQRLFSWHTALFPTGRSGMRKIIVGNWRNDSNGPMGVRSGPIGKETVHFEAPPAERVPDELQKFLNWFENPVDTDPVLVAGLAHLWFLTIHPFDDGNGRIARAIADMTLARAEQSSQRFYSMSAQIRKERNAYDKIIELSQKGELDVSSWLEWFLNCQVRAIDTAQQTLDATLEKARFWQRFKEVTLNPRQIKMLNRLLDGFNGKLTSTKWAKIAKCQQDTACHDITDLIARGALQKAPSGGRKTSYSLVIDTQDR